MSFRTKIREELICAVCLDFLREPKVLVCAHSFCLVCLEGIVKTKLKYEAGEIAIECPSCRHLTPLSGAKVVALKTNYNLKRLVDIVSEDEKQAARVLLRGRTTIKKVDVQQLYMCPKHSAKRVEYFCGECDEILCSKCMVTGHREHGYQHLDDALPKEIENLRSLIQPACEVASRADATMKELFEEKATVSRNTHDTVDAVQTYFHKMIEALNTREKALVSTVRKYGDVKLSSLDTRYNSLQEHRHAILNAVERIESLAESDINVLKQRQALSEEIDTHQQSLLSISDVPKKSTYLSFKRDMELHGDVGTLNECTSEPNTIFVSMRKVIVTEDEDPYLDVPLRFEDGTDHRNSIRVDDTEKVKLVSKPEIGNLAGTPPPLKPRAIAALSNTKINELKATLEQNVSGVASYPSIPPRRNSLRPTKPPKPLPAPRSGGKEVKVAPKLPPKPTAAPKKSFDFDKSKTLPSASRVISNASGVPRKRRLANEKRLKQKIIAPSSSESDPEDYEPIEEFHSPTVVPRKIPPPLPPNHPSLERDLSAPVLTRKPVLSKRRKSYGHSESTDEQACDKRPLKKRSYTLPPGMLSPTQSPSPVEEPELLQPVIIIDNKQMSVAYSHETVYPCGIDYLKSSKMFVVSDVFNHCLRLINASGKYVDKIGREGRSGGQFKEPTAIAIDDSDYIYTVERDNPRVQKFTSSGRYITKFGHKTLLGSQLSDPMGIAVSKGHNASTVYVTDWEKNQIFCYSTGGKLVNVIGKTNGFFKFPAGIAVNKDGTLLVADRSNHCVWVMTSTGDLVTKIGSEGLAEGQLYYPYGVATMENGNILVSESGNCRVSVFTARGDFVRCFGTRGSEPGMFNHPRHLCVNEEGVLAVVDEMNQRIQLFQL